MTRIIIAEDDPGCGRLLVDLINSGRPDVSVTLVRSGAEFLEIVGSVPFDCVVLDYNLGDYLADQLLALTAATLNGRPAVIISSSKEQEIVIASLRNGGVDFMSKDEAFHADAMWERIHCALSNWRRGQADRRKTTRRVEHLRRQSETDELTGLFNRHYLARYFGKAATRPDRRRVTSCISLDIDRFKAINDAFGHAVGDQVLRAVGNTIASYTAGAASAIRTGGEEFLILMPSATLLGAWLWAENLRQEIALLEIVTNGQTIRPTASFGVAEPASGAMNEEIVSAADAALYLAKKRGRDRVCTTGMVAAEAAMIREPNALAGGDEGRRIAFLRTLENRLGPVQREHLEGHCEKVSSVAVKIAEECHLPASAIEAVRLGGLFHDIGKAVLPEELLSKPSSLLMDEARLMSKHVEESLYISQQLGLEAQAAALVQEHHTRFDLAIKNGRNIGAQILNVADALTTMVTGRCYRPARSMEESLMELRRERNHQFDPMVVDAACMVFRPPVSSPPATDASANCSRIKHAA
jgi:diguanylate cyclase (GGDEF)-like protein/putative nucleotidyltransferase with HDIG domain